MAAAQTREAANLRRRALLAAGLVAPVVGALATVAQRRGVWKDAERSQREIPWLAYLPALPSGAWIVYSHGLAGSRDGADLWGSFWAGNGIASIHLQHPGSDAGLLTPREPGRLQRAMNAENLLLRAADMRFAVTQVLALREAGDPDWQGCRPERLGVAGHSFGALTVQALIGQRFEPDFAPSPVADGRLRAALMLSPSLRRGDPARAFADVRIPVLYITGTDDRTPMVQDVDVTQRLLPYQGTPPGQKYQLVLQDGVHASFGGNSGPRVGDRPQATRRIVPLVQQASLLFWRAHLQGDASARQRLNELPAHLSLSSGDQWSAG